MRALLARKEAEVEAQEIQGCIYSQKYFDARFVILNIQYIISGHGMSDCLAVSVKP